MPPAPPLPPPVFPPALRPGDAVALVAPAGPVEATRISGAAAALEARGLEVRVRPDADARDGYLAGSDERRAEELLDALTDPAVRVVWSLRGGYGTQRLLHRLPDEPLGPPRAVVGFSDNTALLNHLRARWGWGVVHGPHPDPDDPAGLEAVLGVLGLGGAPARPSIGGLELLSATTRGMVRAEVAGGCLSLVAAVAGTPYRFRAAGRIVFFEDVAEPPYRLDRLFHQVLASGALVDAAAVVFGRLDAFVPEGGDPGPFRAVVERFAATAPYPVLAGLSAGHVTPNLPVPFGPEALLEPGAGTLTFLRDAVR